MQYIVLGMHKSGTTLLAKTLHKSGVPMGDFNDSLSYDKGNQYERKEVIKINNEILHSEEKQSLKINPNDVDLSKKNRVEVLVRRLDESYEDWGFKDPRTCLTYSLWRPYLCKPKVIVIFRHPRSVAYHYCRTGVKDYILALKRYMQYNKRIHKIGIQENALFVSYDKLINDSCELIRIGKFINKETVNIIDPSMNRSKDKYTIRFWICNFTLFFAFCITPLGLYRKLLKLTA